MLMCTFGFATTKDPLEDQVDFFSAYYIILIIINHSDDCIP